MKIKVYKVREWIEKEFEGKTTHRDNEMVLVEGKRGYIWCDYEYIHHIRDLITDSVRIYIEDKKDGSFSLFPTGYISTQIEEIINKCPCEEKDTKDFFRNSSYNSRLYDNYTTFMKSLKEIGYEGEFDFCGSEKNK